MKRKTVFLLIMLFTAFALISCASGNAGCLPYQKYPMSVTGTLSDGELTCAVTVNMTSAGCGEIMLNSPESLTGYRFKVDNQKISVYYDNIEIELASDRLAEGVRQVIEMFSLNRDSVSGIDVVDTESGVLNRAVFRMNESEITIYTEPDAGIPSRIESSSGGRTLTFDIETLTVQ